MHPSRFFVFTTCILLTLLPAAAQAASWHTFRSRAMGFQVRYPSGWVVTPTNIPGAMRVALGERSGQHSVTVQLVPVRAQRAISASARAVAQYHLRTTGDPSYRNMHWTVVRFGHVTAEAAVTRPIQTEGGLTEVTGIIITQYGRRVYEIDLAGFGRPTPRAITQFPAVYRAVLASWSFL